MSPFKKINDNDNLPLVKSLTRELPCHLDPVTLFESCIDQKENALTNRILLESCEVNTRKNLKSIIVNKSAVRITCNKNNVVLKALTNNGINALLLIEKHFQFQLKEQKDSDFKLEKIDSESLNITYLNSNRKNSNIEESQRLLNITNLDCLRQINQLFFNHSQDNEFKSFLCGLFSFDLIDNFEILPEVSVSLNQCPDYVFYLAEELLVIDNENQHLRIYMNVFAGDNQKNIYYDLSRKIETRIQQIRATEENFNIRYVEHCEITDIQDNKVSISQSDEEYIDCVKKLKQEIIDGNIFQVVPSRTFSLKCINELSSYRHLRESNPSPYMFFMQAQDFTLFGASPESALKYTTSSNSVELYPIAGTRARGRQIDGSIDHDLDKRYEIELKLDQKELSEHMMLVDLARNDIARISKHASIEIPRLLEIDRYSQVMHLVSCVKGQLQKHLDCFHAYQACMNMGTLTGAPKIKAAELIRQVEGSRRGSYGGAVGYINSYGDMDTCIVIRSAYCRDGVAHIQAGAGVVYDSDPASEARETRQKAQAVINAIQQSNKVQMK
ncbi:MAG: anthranilate synthase component I [Kangiella sp.]|nr:MAG: anthranilate synthase component I [Kangiella sp.]